jgi:hypothetical protein
VVNNSLQVLYFIAVAAFQDSDFYFLDIKATYCRLQLA